MQSEPATADDPRSVLQHACDELRRQLLAGQEGCAEQFFSAYPALTSDPASAVELVVTEWGLRHELGQQPRLEQWLERFPAWSDVLRQRLGPDSPRPGSTAASQRTVPVADALPHSGQPDVPLLERALDDHQLLEEIGRGGMGVVYRAWDPILERYVALKKIRSGALVDARAIERFYHEARTAARLRHPNVVPIHGMGLHQGEHCFTMPLMAGGSLAECRGRYTDPRAAAALVEKVARAVQAAHEQGIVHRDLKPANILLDEDGQPLVGDFGVARSGAGGASVTLPGQVMGTPAYMAPEQAAGRTEEVGPASDVWALGVILYELLTRRRPFPGEDAEEVWRQLRTGVFPRPRALRPDLDRALETIVLKGLEQEPERRYASAGALADDLGRWLRGEAIAARPEGRLRRIGRAVRRHPVACAALALAVALAVAVPAFLWLTDPERPRKRLENQLAQGRPAVLLGDTGGPAWSDWVTAPGAVKPALPGRAFTLHTLDLSLLELLRDPQRNRVRLSAQVRWQDSTGGRAGIYFGRVEQITPHGKTHYLWDLTLTEAGLTVEVALKLRRYRQWLPRGANDTVSTLSARKNVAWPPGRGWLGDWHEFIVEVRPEKLRVLWDGAVVGDLDAPRLALYAQALADDGPAAEVPAFSPRGGLGLFVYRGTASFRRVVVEPLAD